MFVTMWVWLRKVRNVEMDHSFNPRVLDRVLAPLCPTIVHVYTQHMCQYTAL